MTVANVGSEPAVVVEIVVDSYEKELNSQIVKARQVHTILALEKLKNEHRAKKVRHDTRT